MKILLILLFLSPAICFTQNRYDIVIDEIMTDPSPTVALPANEWVELKNTSTAPVNLLGWRIGDANTLSGPMTSFILQPDSFVIVCSAGSLAAMSAFGNTISVSSFPSLDNDNDRIFLRSASGITIHAVAYDISWYKNELKKQGGWTLEMVDTKSPCSGISNWIASTDTKGGTPGKKNSADAINTDQSLPAIKYAYTTDSLTVILLFNEPLDSLQVTNITNYTIDGNLQIISATPLAPLFDLVQLKLNQPLQPSAIYNININNITDCMGNTIGINNKTKTGLPVMPQSSDIVINEILFNPRGNGYDYIEIYNRSHSIIDAAALYIANRNSSNTVSSITPITNSSFYLFPGDYLVITADFASLQMNYLVSNPLSVFTLPSLPSWPDDEGTVILMNSQGIIIDEVSYKEDWHFKLLNDQQGVSLERIDPDAASQHAANWHSAATTAGYGTPGYKNSQYKQTGITNSEIKIQPARFSPDNDGHDDITTIQYQFNEPGYAANIIVYDSKGRQVRYLVKNENTAMSGYWNWDGLDDKGKKLSSGIYIIVTNIFNVQGKKRLFRNTVILFQK